MTIEGLINVQRIIKNTLKTVQNRFGYGTIDVRDGGPGSGYRDHAGRPGQRGGSAPKGGGYKSESIGTAVIPPGFVYTPPEESKEATKETPKAEEPNKAEETTKEVKSGGSATAKTGGEAAKTETKSDPEPQNPADPVYEYDIENGVGSATYEKDGCRVRVPFALDPSGKMKHGDHVATAFRPHVWERRAKEANDFSRTRFTPEGLKQHINKHGMGPMGDKTYKDEAEMTSAAQRLLGMPVGGDIRGFARGDGSVLRYNTKTKELAIGTPGWKINSIHILNKRMHVTVDGKEVTLIGDSYYEYQESTFAVTWEKVSE